MTTNRKTRPEAAGTEALLALSQLALDRMEQGVCVYDADNRIVLLNRRYLELDWQGFRIWGVTAAIIANLSRRIAWEDVSDAA